MDIGLCFTNILISGGYILVLRGRVGFQIHRGNDVQPLPLIYIVIMFSGGENPSPPINLLPTTDINCI